MRKTILIPEKIPSWNKFYAGRHWSTRKKIADYWHELVWNYCYTTMTPHFKRAWITIESHSKRPLDPDNICAKLIIDGLVHAKVLDDDSPEFVKGVLTISKKSDKELTKVIISHKWSEKVKTKKHGNL